MPETTYPDDTSTIFSRTRMLDRMMTDLTEIYVELSSNCCICDHGTMTKETENIIDDISA